MSKVTAVICECNPLHLGHEAIFANAKQSSDVVIAVMSGNYVQRAEAAIFDKYTRAEIVCRCGADLVVELPFPWSSASAEFFASAGVHIANALNADTLMFGANQKEEAFFWRLADYLCDSECAVKERQQAELGMGAARSREEFLAEKFGDDIRSLLRSPNDILAVEYCKSIRLQNASLDIRAFPRISTHEDPNIRSATVLRSILAEGSPDEVRQHIPDTAYEIICRKWEKGHYTQRDALAQLEFIRLRSNPLSADTAEGANGVLARLQNASHNAQNGPEMFAVASTKKYTNARFRRAALYYLLNIFSEDIRALPAYTTVLAARQKGCAYLSEIRKKAGIRILTKPSDCSKLNENELRQYEKSCEADRLYTLCMQQVQPCGFFIKMKPWIELDSNK